KLPRGLDKKIRLPRHDLGARLSSSVTIRMRKTLDRRTGHEERFEDAFVNHAHRTRSYAFVIKTIPSVEVNTPGLFPGRIEDNRQELGQHGAVHTLGESLSFSLVFLPMPLHPVAEYFVKKHTRGAPGKDRWSEKWIHHRSLQ